MFPVKISYLNTRKNVERIVFEFIFRVNLNFFLRYHSEINRRKSTLSE